VEKVRRQERKQNEPLKKWFAPEKKSAFLGLVAEPVKSWLWEDIFTYSSSSFLTLVHILAFQ
jgi:hypothetical protein